MSLRKIPKILSILLSGILSLLAFSKPIDVIFDMDGVLMGGLLGNDPQNRIIVDVDSGKSRIYAGTLEMLSYYFSHPEDYRVNFFTARKRDDALSLLSRMYIGDKSVLELSKSVKGEGPRVWTQEDMTNDAKTKDISVIRGINLNEAVFAEDTPENIALGQWRNFLTIYSMGVDRETRPRTARFILGIVDLAKERAEANHTTFQEEFQDIVRVGNEEGAALTPGIDERTNPLGAEIFRRGDALVLSQSKITFRVARNLALHEKLLRFVGLGACFRYLRSK